MKSLIQYEEYGPNMGFPSMTTYFEAEPYPNIEKIIYYLENGTKTYVRAGLGKDFFTGERFGTEYVGMTDGEYSWNTSLVYYVKKYNLRLPMEFENKVVSRLSETTRIIS